MHRLLSARGMHHLLLSSVQQVFSKLASVQPSSGLYPLFVDVNSGAFQGNGVPLAAV